jgi:predicted Zn-dependent protease
MPRSHWCASAALLALTAACRDSGAATDWPRFSAPDEVDPLILRSVSAAESACERGEPGARVELAKVYDANDLNNLALETYTLLLARGEGGARPGELAYHQGRVLEELGRAPEAIEAYGRAIASADDYAAFRWRRGSVLLEAGRVEEARADFERALVIEPENVTAKLGLARALLALDEVDSAHAVLTGILARRPNQRLVHGLLARVALARGDEARAQDELRLEEEAKAWAPPDPLTAEIRDRATGVLASVRRARELLDEDQPRKAVESLEEVYAAAPGDLAVLQMLAQALLADGKPERALEVLLPGSELHPRDDKLQLYLGIAQRARGAHAEALAHFERACELDSTYAPSQVLRAQALLVHGQRERAQAALARAVALGDESAATLRLLGETHAGGSDWKRAAETFARLCRVHPETFLHWVLLAEARARAGERPAAEEALAEAERRGAPKRRLETARRVLEDAGGPR